ncbi:TPA: ribokinase, partial [Enterobacter hormaechei]|nr:ribokinase [Enterobacter hormaechei]
SHCAGVLAGLACGQPLTDAVRTGNAVAAIVVSRPGSDGAPTRSELSEFLHHHL